MKFVVRKKRTIVALRACGLVNEQTQACSFVIRIQLVLLHRIPGQHGLDVMIEARRPRHQQAFICGNSFSYVCKHRVDFPGIASVGHVAENRFVLASQTCIRGNGSHRLATTAAMFGGIFNRRQRLRPLAVPAAVPVLPGAVGSADDTLCVALRLADPATLLHAVCEPELGPVTGRTCDGARWTQRCAEEQFMAQFGCAGIFGIGIARVGR